jgi:hypothetical protein
MGNTCVPSARARPATQAELNAMCVEQFHVGTVEALVQEFLPDQLIIDLSHRKEQRKGGQKIAISYPRKCGFWLEFYSSFADFVSHYGNI